MKKKKDFVDLNCRHTLFIIYLLWNVGLERLGYVRWVNSDGFWVYPGHLEVFSVRANDV